MIVGIIGNGFVGKATFQLKCKDVDVLAYDINPNMCVPAGLKLEDMMKCEFIFISVPTPMSKNGECHTNIVETVIGQLRQLNYQGFIVLRSTVPVGTCDRLKVYFMPEFLTEKNYIQDFINNKDWVFGLRGDEYDELFKQHMEAIINIAHDNNKISYNNTHFMTNKEAEMVKMFKNCYLAAKVSFCNEIYSFCNSKGVNYENVRKVACADSRIGHSHSYVPGPDGKTGFSGTCFPKDTSSLQYEMDKSGMETYVLKAVIDRNNNVDRKDHDWNDNKGRAVVN
jgi:UDPglucose 6-dehydrogenase